MLVAVLKDERAARLYQEGIGRVYNHFYRHDFSYRHASANCAGISMETLRSIGWMIPTEGTSGRVKAALALPYMTLKERSLESGRNAYDYLSVEVTDLYPFAAFQAAGTRPARAGARRPRCARHGVRAHAGGGPGRGPLRAHPAISFVARLWPGARGVHGRVHEARAGGPLQVEDRPGRAASFSCRAARPRLGRGSAARLLVRARRVCSRLAHRCGVDLALGLANENAQAAPPEREGSMGSQWRLMRERRFGPLFFTQFLGAFNDNVFKTALVTLIAFQAGRLTSADPRMLATALPGLFIVPFFVFSATSGRLADKRDRAAIARAVNVFEIGVMSLAAWGFLTNGLWELIAALFLMGVHSTVFGPVKYGYLPQHLRPDELVGGNGLIEMGTFLAILLGEVLGAWLAVGRQGGSYASIAVGGVAVLGYRASRGIPATPPVDPALKVNWNPFTETWKNLRFARRNRTVWLSLLGISWFWFYGATMLAQFPNYAKDVLGGDETVFVLLLTVFSVGIGTGSLLCERLSGRKVEIGLVPFGAIGLTVFGVDLFFATPAPADGASFTAFIAAPGHWRLLADLALLLTVFSVGIGTGSLLCE